MNFPIETTLNRIKACSPCESGWRAGLAAAGQTNLDEPISYESILDAVGLDNAFWCCRAEPQHADLWRLYAVWCARQVQHLMADPRSITALDIAQRHALRKATDEELAAAAAAADAAADAAARAAVAVAAIAAAWAAAWAAAVARAAAGADAAVAAAVAVGAAAGAAAVAAAVAGAAAGAAARAAQVVAFRQLVTTGDLPT